MPAAAHADAGRASAARATTCACVQDANRTLTVLACVAAGLGWSLLPRSVRSLQHDGVRYAAGARRRGAAVLRTGGAVAGALAADLRRRLRRHAGGLRPRAQSIWILFVLAPAGPTWRSPRGGRRRARPARQPITSAPVASRRWRTSGSLSSGRELLGQPLDHRRRRARRHEDRVPLVDLVARQARLGHRRQLRQHRRTRLARHRERAQLAALDVRQARRQAGEEHRHLARHHVGQRRAAALVGHVRHAHAGHGAELLGRQVLGRAVARRGEVDLARLGPGLRDQVLHAAGSVPPDSPPARSAP